MKQVFQFKNKLILWRGFFDFISKNKLILWRGFFDFISKNKLILWRVFLILYLKFILYYQTFIIFFYKKIFRCDMSLYQILYSHHLSFYKGEVIKNYNYFFNFTFSFL